VVVAGLDELDGVLLLPWLFELLDEEVGLTGASPLTLAVGAGVTTGVGVVLCGMLTTVAGCKVAGTDSGFGAGADWLDVAVGVTTAGSAGFFVEADCVCVDLALGASAARCAPPAARETIAMVTKSRGRLIANLVKRLNFGMFVL